MSARADLFKPNRGHGRAIEKGGKPVGQPPAFQDLTMLNVVESPVGGKISTAPGQQKFHTVSDTRRAQIWLDSKVAKAKSGIFSEVADLTPELAEILLGRNDGNRTFRASRIAEFAKDISNGDWKLNGEPLIISHDGMLNDGQHRCAAVIECKIPTPMLMTFGVARDTRDTLDQGTMRTAADFLSMHGAEDSKYLAGAARALWQYQKFGFISMTSMNHAPTRSEVKRTALDHPGLAKSLAFISRPGTKALSSRSLLAFCHFAFKRIAGDAPANYFMDAFIDGADLKRGDPILYVRNRFIAEKKKIKSEERAELLFRAWNAHRLGEDRIMLRTYGGELPMLEA
jgi:hypothetical protein